MKNPPGSAPASTNQYQTSLLLSFSFEDRLIMKRIIRLKMRSYKTNPPTCTVKASVNSTIQLRPNTKNRKVQLFFYAFSENPK